MSNTYTYGIHQDLEPAQLYFIIFLDTASKHLGVADLTALGAFIVGQPFLPTRAKPAGAIKGTSIASVVTRKLLPMEVKSKILPTLIGINPLKLKLKYTNNVGVFAGRAIPYIGIVILLYDVVKISADSVHVYNSHVKEEDKLF
jgi:hypothetical protein